VSKLDHVALAVSDWRRSRDWYAEMLGLTLEFELADGGAARLGAAALKDEDGLTLFLEQASGEIAPCACVHYFQVADVDVTYAALSRKGVAFLRPPQKQFWGYGAELADPDGHLLRLWDENSMREKGDG
jgi:catechol 2,3-dioxygenase-like lactoylglutathione lyase family enzyme